MIVRRFAVPLLPALLALLSAPAAAAEPVRFADDPALSPDGATLAFAWRGDVWAVDAAGGTARRLTTHPATDARPRWSPDGATIAFDSDRDGTRQLYTMPAAGGAARRVSAHTAGYTLQGWSPDGSALLAVGARDHHWRNANRFFKVTIPADGVVPGELETAPDELLFDAYGQNGSLSPDGTKLLYVREGERWWRKGYRGPQAAQIWLWDSSDNTHTELLRPPGGARSPVWRADGNAFYYVGRGVTGEGETIETGGTPESPAFDLRVYDFFKRTAKPLTKYADDGVLNPTVAGTTAVYRRLFDLYRLDLSADDAEPAKIEITVAADDAPAKLTRRELRDAADATVSADGLEWALAAGGDVWITDTVLREPVLVTRSEGDADLGSPAWDTEPVFVGGSKKTGPEKLLFLSESDGQVDLYRRDPAGRIPAVVAAGGVYGRTPDGRRRDGDEPLRLPRRRPHRLRPRAGRTGRRRYGRRPSKGPAERVRRAGLRLGVGRVLDRRGVAGRRVQFGGVSAERRRDPRTR